MAEGPWVRGCPAVGENYVEPRERRIMPRRGWLHRTGGRGLDWEPTDLGRQRFPAWLWDLDKFLNI